ncbi:MAG: alpha/beta fold hydrolase [Acidobacteria bacterium]|nr:alpha/beta fold hydrolase [Acidobacteriota bacterium]
MPKTKVNDINIYYETQGQGDPVLLIYGLAGRGNGFIKQVPELSAGYQTIIFDNRGVGETDQPDEPFSIAQIADDAAGLLDHLGIDSAHVFGISMGGMIAQEFALRHPNRTRKLVLGCTHCGIKHCIPSPPWVAEIFKALVGKPREQIVRECVPFNYSEYTQKNDRQLIESMNQLMIPNLQQAYSYKLQLKAVYEFDTFERLPSLKMPVLLLTGKEDVLIPPENSRIIADRIPGSRLIEFDQAGHLFFIEKADEVNRTLLDFFRS